MYAFFIAVYMLLNVRSIYTTLSAIEGGFAAFSKLEWVMAVLAVIMVPMSVLMLIKAYRDAKRSIVEKKEETERAEQEKQQRMQQEYYLDDSAEEEAAEILRQAADAAASAGSEKKEEDKGVFDS